MLGLLQSVVTAIEVLIVGYTRGSWHWVSSPSLIEAFTKYWVKTHTLKPKYQVVEDDAASNEGNCPFMMLGQCYLNLKFAEGLKAAFEHPDCMLRVYPDLAIEEHNNTKWNRAGLTFDK